MLEYIFPTAVLLAAFTAACVAILAGIGSLNAVRKVRDGVLHYFFYATLLSNALLIALSTRSFATDTLLQESSAMHPVASWAIRLTSLLALVASADLAIRYFMPRDRKLEGPRMFLALALIFFWTTNLLLPAFFAAHRAPLQLNWFYSLVLGLGLIFLTNAGGDRCVLAVRNSTLVFCAASLLLIPVKPALVLDFNYNQGYLPGVPRFAGLAPHAIVMGMTAAVGLWCLVAYPMKSRTLNVLCWAACLCALFLSQAKAVWVSFLITLPVMLYYQRSLPSWAVLSSRKYRDLTLALLIVAMIGMALIAGLLMFGGIGAKVDRLLNSDKGAQLMTLTGRDQIWAIALAEWRKSPVFGYGLTLFGPEFRAQIGMSYAVHGHNQLIDSLGRAGTLGGASTLVYGVGLLWLGMRYARSSRGLSAALAVSIAIRMISELPIGLGNIGVDSTPYYLLLATIAAGIGRQPKTGDAAHA